MPLTPTQIRTGSDDQGHDGVLIQAGNLSARLCGSEIRDIRLGGWLAVERLYVAVRDSAWNTVPCQRRGLELTSTRAGELAVITASHELAPGSSFSWTGRLELTAPATLSFSFRGEAVGSVTAGKIGICIHHPAASAGRRYQAQHQDGTSSGGRLPRLVGPGGDLRALFREFEALTVEGPGGRSAQFVMSGELFETQDHRNWTDHNFKSYAVPNWKPTPVTYVAGDVVEQGIRLTLTGPPARARRRVLVDCVPVAIDGALSHSHAELPRLGSTVSAGVRLDDADNTKLRDAGLDHVGLSLDLQAGRGGGTSRKGCPSRRRSARTQSSS